MYDVRVVNRANNNNNRDKDESTLQRPWRLLIVIPGE